MLASLAITLPTCRLTGAQQVLTGGLAGMYILGVYNSATYVFIYNYATLSWHK